MPAIEPSTTNPSDQPAKPRPENLLVNLVCNVVVPTVILTGFSGARWLGPKWGLVIALLFPVSYGLYDFAVRRRWNFISIIGFVSVLASMRAKAPLVNELLYNPQVIDVEKVDAALAARGAQAAFAALLRRSTGLLSLSFFASAVLNYFLARHLIRSPPGTEAFNGELGKMHIWSLPVIVLPSMAMMMLVLWRLLGGITALTGLTLDDIFRAPPEKPKPAAK